MSVYTNYTNHQLVNNSHASINQPQHQEQRNRQHVTNNHTYIIHNQQQHHHPQPQPQQHSSSNGAPNRYHYQVDNDYLHRGFPQASQPDMSVQLTRPTSKTALLVRQRRAMLEQLSCYLCKGYLIDATTVDECMDSFCKSCIVIHLRSHVNCPKCNTLIHKTNPLSAIRSDKVLQDIVYKLVPGLYDDEMKRRREFYKGLLGASSEEDDDEGSSGSFTEGRCSNMNSEQYGVISHPKSFYKPTDSIDLSIEPLTRGESTTIYYDNRRQSIVTSFAGSSYLQHQQSQLVNSGVFSVIDSQLFKTYLRCPAKLTALQLKKFIVAKFNLCKDDSVHLRYLNESLKDEYSLIDIAYIYDWRGIEHMRLYYIIERDISKTPSVISHDSPKDDDRQLRKAKTRQSVGTSTQTIKRVCINPHPKYYALEQNNNFIANPIGQRTTRSRNEISANATSVVPTTSQTHTLRSHSSPIRDNIVQQSTSADGIQLSKNQFAPSSTQAKVISVANSISSAVDELSRIRQGNATKDTRSTRRSTAEPTGPIPKININLNSLNKPLHFEHGHRNLNSYSRPSYKNDTGQREVSTTRGNIDSTTQSTSASSNHLGQIVHYVRRGCSTTTTTTMSNAFSGPTQSSMITLANLTESRSSHVMAIASASTSSTMTSDRYTNLLSSSGSPDKFGSKSVEVKSNHISTKTNSQTAPQLAFSFVTERGITIVRSPAITSNSNRINATVPALPAPAKPSSSQTSSSPSQQGRSDSSSTLQSTQPSRTTNDRSLTGDNGCSSQASTSATSPSGRHHTKVKPVYKTFVDPTKLKSPNFKKFGFTARH